MTEAGFRVTVGVDRKTGFIYGGNRHNCGTWMDKMGSSSKAGNRGVPSTPRDGSAVEIIGLSYSVISWLVTLFRDIWPYEGVTCPETNISWTYREWESRIKDNFDDYFFISSQDSNPVINRRHIYKDTLGASEVWQDVQLRPNWVIASAVAPDLFVREHVQEALKIFEDVLLGPEQLGVKTLDPSDWNYRGDYDNSNNSEDPKVAHGANYHNGPEWIWPLGYYLRARLNFSVDIKKENIYFNRLLSRHLRHIESSPWGGLPELTNAGGVFCKDSCTIQAWSIATILDALYDLSTRAKKNMGPRKSFD